MLASSTLSLNTIDFESKKRNCREKQGERNTYNGLATTPEGRRLLGAVTTMKHDDMALRRTFDEGKTGRRQLIFGVTMTIGEYVIGKYLASYIRRHPETRIRRIWL